MSSWHQYDTNKEQHGKDRRKYCFDCYTERWCGGASVWLWGVQVSLTEKKYSQTVQASAMFAFLSHTRLKCCGKSVQ